MKDMSNFYLNRPITTGAPRFDGKPVSGQPKTAGEQTASFQEVLTRRLEAQKTLTFSKHATQRVQQRGIDLSESSMARLSEGVRLAQQKGLDDTLILVDRTAFLVSVKNNKVITTVNSEELNGNVFTNIDGTVII